MRDKERLPEVPEDFGFFKSFFPEKYLAVRIEAGPKGKTGRLVAAGESKDVVMQVVEEDRQENPDPRVKYYHVFGPMTESSDVRSGWIVMVEED